MKVEFVFLQKGFKMFVFKNIAIAHIPKTGGTSLEKMVRDSIDKKDLIIDDDKYQLEKHDSFTQKEKRINIDISNKKKVLPFRRLPAWFFSYANHKNLIFEDSFNLINDNLVYTYIPPTIDPKFIKKINTASKNRDFVFLKKIHNTLSPDDILTYYLDYKIDYYIRTEYMQQDFNFLIKKELGFNPSNKKIHLNKRSYPKKQLELLSDKSFVKKLYDNNPIWTKIERELYGKLEYEY